MIYSLIGLSGCGKGSQAKRLSEALKGIPILSTGELFREEITKGTEFGKKAEVFVNQGEWPPDEMVEALLKARLEAEKGGFILDAFPRTVGQAQWLEGYLAQRGTPLNGVIFLKTSMETAVKRIRERVKKEEQEREDETPEAIRSRIASFSETISPILRFYKERGILVEVNNEGTIEGVHQQILSLLGLPSEER